MNGRVIWEETAGQRIDYRYDGNDKLISMQLDNNEYFYVHNIQGDIVGLVDQTGVTVAHYAYDAWGVPTSITDGQGNDVSGNASAIANVNPYRYRGYRYDRETGLYYLQSRYYNPQWGRFVNADILTYFVEGLNIYENLFSYAKGNPIMFYDPTGYVYVRIVRRTLSILTFDVYLSHKEVNMKFKSAVVSSIISCVGLALKAFSKVHPAIQIAVGVLGVGWQVGYAYLQEKDLGYGVIIRGKWMVTTKYFIVYRVRAQGRGDGSW